MKKIEKEAKLNERPLRERISYKKAARINGVDQDRFYDRIVQTYDGTWVGLEIKYRTGQRDAKQRAYDNLISPENPAIVKLEDGGTIRITEIRVVRVQEEDIRSSL